MKTWIAIAFMLTGLSLNAQDDKTPTQSNKTSTYCFEAKGDVVMLTKDGNKVESDIKLDDGTRLTINGRIIKPDGTERKLKEGECVDMKGEMTTPVKK